MRSRRRAAPLFFIVLVAAGALAGVLAKGYSPQLGLDLQGGASVVYQAGNDVSNESIDQAMAIIRSRVDALGVAEPEIARQGDAIVVNLPGVRDQQRALDIIGKTAELRFRPVLFQYPGIDPNAPTTTVTAQPSPVPSDPSATSTTVASPGDSSSTTEAGLGAGEVAAGPRQDTSTTTTPADATTSTSAVTDSTAPGDTTSTTVSPDDPCGGTTPPEQDTAEATVTLPGKDDADENGIPDVCFVLGPVPTDVQGDPLVGSAIRDAKATIPQGEWVVQLEIKGDKLDLFNQISTQCFNRDQTVCPTGQLAIVLDGVVQSAPVIQAAEFDSTNGIQLSGTFSEREAKDLALVLRFGALPVELVPQTVQTVSATLGKDSLHAGLIAGSIGVALVAIYMLLYYRALGVVVILGLAVWSALLFSIISYLGHSRGLALSLAGVTGIIVSVGVTVDSYVVYFERLKDEIRSGKTIRSSVDRGFQRAFRTILAADVSSFIGAFLLWWLTVGAVRGFAFFLGLSTVLDVAVAWFFTRPLVGYLGRSAFFTENRVFGVARGLGVNDSRVESVV